MRREPLGVADLIDLYCRGLLPALLPELTDDEVVNAILTVPDHFASTFSGTIAARLTVLETIAVADEPVIDTRDQALQFSLGPSEAIASVTGLAAFSKALSAGAATIDLTSLTHRGTTVSFSGKKVKYCAFANPSTNANQISITEGAVNGHPLAGAAWKLILQPGDFWVAKLANSTTVAGADLAWDLAGTGTQALSCLLAAG